MIKYLKSFTAFCLLVIGTAIACTDEPEEIVEQIEEETPSSCEVPLFIEEDKFVKGDFEVISDTNGWDLEKEIGDYEGEGYLVWKGNNNFSTTGIAKLTYKIQITNPGIYRFIWRSRITEGDSNTEANDTWLRFPDADDFYGMKLSGEIVYSKGSGKTPLPEGAGSGGWFKVYMNTLGQWAWRSTTSDRDPHNIFVEFKNPGKYTMEISARSAYHAIDRFVLFQLDIPQPTSPSVDVSELVCDS